MPQISGATPEAASEQAAEPASVRQFYALKDGDAFVVADSCGNITGDGDGFFHNDTRLLSRFELTLGGTALSLLSRSVSGDNVFFVAHMTNRPLPLLGGQSAPEGVIHIERTRFIWAARLYERITCVNYGSRDVFLPLRLVYAADFRDMFEVRGTLRRVRGRLLPVKIVENCVVAGYEGLDGVMRSTVITFSGAPVHLTSDSADFLLTLPANQKIELFIEVGVDNVHPDQRRFRTAAAQARRAMRLRRRRGARLHSSGRLFNEWIEKSRADLALLTSELPTGPYPYAGIPWFSTPFGRDAIVTALQTLWLDPALARGVLRFLAKYQAHETSSFQDAAPGKIMHETRKGEMTALRELPFGQYYGGVDTTPLFIMLAGAYADRTGDLAFIEEMWPALSAAQAWIDSVAASNEDGFLVYARAEESGLVNQAWKDSGDSIFHADGRIPRGPIAVIEVQGYVFAALRAMAGLAERRGEKDAAVRWRNRAEKIRLAVEKKFWMEDVGFYGIAIDGSGDLCRVKASNVGHLLYTGIPSKERADKAHNLFLSPMFDTGWGIRTLAPQQARFNPMSYHNGSVWPHDTAFCAAGLARYGERDGVMRLVNGMFETAVRFDMRLPELFCGFPRASGEGPIAYPVACLPQAWAAGSIFMMMQACLGLSIDGWKGEIHIDRPHLPVGIDSIRIHGLAVGGESLNVVLQRVGERVAAFTEGPSNRKISLHVRV